MTGTAVQPYQVLWQKQVPVSPAALMQVFEWLQPQEKWQAAAPLHAALTSDVPEDGSFSAAHAMLASTRALQEDRQVDCSREGGVTIGGQVEGRGEEGVAQAVEDQDAHADEKRGPDHLQT